MLTLILKILTMRLRDAIGIFDKYYTCSIISNNSNQEIMLFKDLKVSSTSDLTIFIREFKDTTLFYIDGELISCESKLDNVYIRKLRKAEVYSYKFLTLDIETQGKRVSSNVNSLVQSLVSISIYTGTFISSTDP